MRSTFFHFSFFFFFNSIMTTLKPSSIFLLLLVVWLFSSATESFRFDLQGGRTKCITEEIANNSLTVGKYQVVNHEVSFPLPDSHRVTARVTSSSGNYYHYVFRASSGQFTFVAPYAGEYFACFWASDHTHHQDLTIDFEWKSGVATNGWSDVAKKNQVDQMEAELMQMYGTAFFIRSEMYYLRLREKEMWERNGATTDTMLWLSMLSILICMSVAGLQVWHLKGFFEKKKVI